MEKVQLIRCGQEGCAPEEHTLIGEEPLVIRVEGNPYSVVMRTPGDEMAHVAGFCLGEGLIDAADDFASLGYCRDLDPNVVEVRLTPARLEKVAGLVERRGFVSQTSCGICGKELVEDLQQALDPVRDVVRFAPEQLWELTEKLLDHQVHYARTRGSHATLLLNEALAPISFAEDVGRHNGLDKAIGKLVLQENLEQAAVAVLSSRISYELVQKTARARLGVLVSKSRPTALAVALGDSLGMTLACNARVGELNVYCGGARLGLG